MATPFRPGVASFLSSAGVDIDAIDRRPSGPPDDDDAPEIELRRRLLREAKGRHPDPDRSLSYDELDALFPPTWADWEYRQRRARRHAASPPEPPEEPVISTPEPAAKSESHPCPTCGEPTHPANGRCYACRPGGMRTVGGARARRVEPTASTDESGVSTRRPRKSPGRLPGDVPLDPEVAAMARCVDALAGLDDDQVGRLLGYLRLRFTPAAAGAGQGGVS